MLFRTLSLPVVALGLCCALRGQAQEIPADTALHTGRLPNGFTYYIRRNTQPQQRAELYLVNKIGSILENEDQRGLAHFMEHMNFNGSTHFPKNELVNYLQKAGVRFGADLNAYTSFDETVYQLPVPAGMLPDGLRILRDWAQEATMDSLEIEKERGIVLEEERLGKGAKDRMSRQYYPVLLNHSRYADRIPIGLDTVLKHFKPAVIRQFHHDWYRPDLQALIVVGDIDPVKTEAMVRAQFSDLENPKPERPRPAYAVALTGRSQFLAVTDAEASEAAIELLFKQKADPMVTAADYLCFVQRQLLLQMLSSRRYATISRAQQPAYANMNAGLQPFLGGLSLFFFDVTLKPGQYEQGFTQAWQILENVRRYGFTAGELARAKTSYLRTLETALQEQDKTPSINFVKEYQQLFLHQEAAPGIRWEQAFTASHINGITLADINALLQHYLDNKNLDIILSAPEAVKAQLPGEATVRGWMQAVRTQPLTPFREDSLQRPLMTTKPLPGHITDRSYVASLQLTRLTLSNGVTVILKPTDFKNNEIRFSGVSSGGTSLYDDNDFDAAAAAAGLVSRFGLAGLNPIQLNQALTGKVVNVSANIQPRSQTLSGVTTPADLETALQLAYLQFTQPGRDSTLFASTISSAKAMVTNRLADPTNVFSDTIAQVMGNYSYRSGPPTPEKLDKITLQRAYDIYRERFSDAAGFTFVFVGNFNTDSIAPLIAQYLGALPATYKKEQARDLGIHIPTGQWIKKVYKGLENKALVRIVYSGDYPYSQLHNLQLKALGDILQIRLTEDLREAEGEVYSPAVQVQYNKLPKSRYAMVVSFGCAPGNVDHLVERVGQLMQEMSANGPSQENVDKFKAAYSKNLELVLKDNNFWLGYLSGQYENQEDPQQVLQLQQQADSLDVTSLTEAADLFYSDKNRIIFALLPETSKH
ncbi:peptidase M16 [Chitinophaga parva]|uniref:Peptidase M16 n=1 Tax=Chitinophaga parva TaxID=2169414 RepID=A0A2T7BCG5_9BACT|nr:insulinase family protein [Chitinophaga parva]PUZ22765.1 peptidase M16 [Chitinophaga parva]